MIFGDFVVMMNPAKTRFCYDVSSRYIKYLGDACEVGNTVLRGSFLVLPDCPLHWNYEG